MAKRISLDNVCVKKIPTLSSQYDGIIDYVDISSVDNTEKRIVSMQCVSAKDAPSRAKQLLEVGDILVSTVRPNLNAVAMVEQKTDNLLVGSTGYCVLRCNNSIDKRYVFHFCQSPYFVDDMTSQATGASYPAVSTGIVKSSTIPNHPIEKQKQIADRLDKVSELIALRKEQLAKLDQLVKSRFIELFGSPVANEYGWPVATLGELCLKITDGEHQNPQFIDSGIPMVMANNVQDKGVVLDGCRYISAEDYEKFSRKCCPEFGDVLLVSRGATIGRCCKNSESIPFSLMGSVILIKNNKERISSTYLVNWLKNEEIKPMIYSTSSASAQQAIYMKDLVMRKVSVPPMELQEQFASFVEQTDKSKLAIQQSLDKLELLKKSLMQEYFG